MRYKLLLFVLINTCLIHGNENMLKPYMGITSGVPSVFAANGGVFIMERLFLNVDIEIVGVSNNSKWISERGSIGVLYRVFDISSDNPSVVKNIYMGSALVKNQDEKFDPNLEIQYRGYLPPLIGYFFGVRYNLFFHDRSIFETIPIQIGGQVFF